jgi:hypothetical protein
MKAQALLVLGLLSCSGAEFTAAEELDAKGGSAGSAAGAQARGGATSSPGGAAGSSPSSGAAGVVALPGGSGGAAGGGAGGDGGDELERCASSIPPKAEWVATAEPEALTEWPAELAIDGDGATRFSTGMAQAGGEWLQVDFGRSVELSSVVIDCCEIVLGYPESLEDYARAFEVRLSDVPNDQAGPVLAQGVGAPGPIVATFERSAGRFLLITQTGSALESYWSVHEINARCE